MSVVSRACCVLKKLSKKSQRFVWKLPWWSSSKLDSESIAGASFSLGRNSISRTSGESLVEWNSLFDQIYCDDNNALSLTTVHNKGLKAEAFNRTKTRETRKRSICRARSFVKCLDLKAFQLPIPTEKTSNVIENLVQKTRFRTVQDWASIYLYCGFSLAIATNDCVFCCGADTLNYKLSCKTESSSKSKIA